MLGSHLTLSLTIMLPLLCSSLAGDESASGEPDTERFLLRGTESAMSAPRLVAFSKRKEVTSQNKLCENILVVSSSSIWKSTPILSPQHHHILSSPRPKSIS